MSPSLWGGIIIAAMMTPAVAMAQPGNAMSWHKYVRAPHSTTVRPATILANMTAGDVTNPGGLVSGSGDVTILKSSGDGGEEDAPQIVVDFGQNVVGKLVLDFAGSETTTSSSSDGETAVSAFPGLRLFFSESLEYLGDTSDFTRSDNADGELKIVTTGSDQVAVKNESYTWTDDWGCDFNDGDGEQKVCHDGLHGFRYVKIKLEALPQDSPHTTSGGSVSINSVSLDWSAFLGTPDTFSGWFECSDEELTQWWFDAAYTNEMCTDTFREEDTDPRQSFSESLNGKKVLYDGAKRDRDPYIGDVSVQGLTAYLTHNDMREAARNMMEDLALHQREDGWIPPASINSYTLPLFDYPLWWVVAGYDHVMYTGNTSYMTSHADNLLAVLDTYYPSHTDNSTGLLRRPSGYGDFAFVPRDGSAAYYSVLYVHALRRAADLVDTLLLSSSSSSSSTSSSASSFPDPEAPKRWRARASRFSDSIVSQLWDPEAGAFLDRACADVQGEACKAHAQDANSIAVLAGISHNVDDVQNQNQTLAQSSLSYLSSSTAQTYGNAFYDSAGEAVTEGYSERVYAFMSYFEMAARFEVEGQQSSSSSTALDQIRRTYRAMTGPDADPGITFWEGIGPGGTKYEQGFTSLAHGWSTGVAPLLTGYILGVKPTGRPGFAEFEVMPHVLGKDGIQWARGLVPTPMLGEGEGIRVSWEMVEDGSKIMVDVDAPEGAEGKIKLPRPGEEGKVVVDGNEVGLNGEDGTTIEVVVKGGKNHHVVVVYH